MCVHTAVYGCPCLCTCTSVGGSQRSISSVLLNLHLPYLFRQKLIEPKAYQFIQSVSSQPPCLHPFISTWTTYVLCVAGVLQGIDDPSSGPQVWLQTNCFTHWAIFLALLWLTFTALCRSKASQSTLHISIIYLNMIHSFFFFSKVKTFQSEKHLNRTGITAVCFSVFKL